MTTEDLKTGNRLSLELHELYSIRKIIESANAIVLGSGESRGSSAVSLGGYAYQVATDRDQVGWSWTTKNAKNEAHGRPEITFMDTVKLLALAAINKQIVEKEAEFTALGNK